LSPDRTQRLKDARIEALAEIEALKKQKDHELLENDKKVPLKVPFDYFTSQF
jgi:hypothetical protein